VNGDTGPETSRGSAIATFLRNDICFGWIVHVDLRPVRSRRSNLARRSSANEFHRILLQYAFRRYAGWWCCGIHTLCSLCNLLPCGLLAREPRNALIGVQP
jgi:hypothetical protein